MASLLAVSPTQIVNLDMVEDYVLRHDETQPPALARISMNLKGCDEIVLHGQKALDAWSKLLAIAARNDIPVGKESVSCCS